MDNLVLVKKRNRAEVLENARKGRPKRETFALRRYGDAFIICLPHGVTADGDKVDFYLSNEGFAVKIGPDCSRTVSGKKSTKTASIPIDVRQRLQLLPEGSRSLAAQEMPGNMWYFPFSTI